jgi:Trk K+ transport system NAD-binding subunit
MSLTAAPRAIIVVGNDHLALSVCAELRGSVGYDAVLLWDGEPALAAQAAAAGAEFAACAPDAPGALASAHIDRAAAIVALSSDDRLNLQVALRARDHNPAIRIVLRQFNRTLGRKIEENLENCAVLSLASYSAATFASAAVDPAVFQAVQFPYIGGPLLGFARVEATDHVRAARSIAEAQTRAGGRILAVDGVPVRDGFASLAGSSELTVFRKVTAGPPPAAAPAARIDEQPRLSMAARLTRLLIRADPVLRWFVFLSLAVFAGATAYFTFVTHVGPLNAAFLVAEILSTNGPSDISFKQQGPWTLLFAMFLMFAGVSLTGFFVALLTSQLTKLQWVTLQGLRPIHKTGHVVICGAGSVGSSVIDYLLALNLPLVVIELSPKASIIEAAREKHFDILTGDATQDSTLELCNIERARALIALTENDTMNLEVALSARARNPNLQVVMRVVDGAFESSVRAHFGLDTTFAPATLAAPAFGGLVFNAGARGRVEFGGEQFGICEAKAGDPVLAADFIPLCVWRSGAPTFIDQIGDLRDGETGLFLVPLHTRRALTLRS